MNKKVGIISLYGNNNYGNKLQSYALQKVLNNNDIYSENIVNFPSLNNKRKRLIDVLKYNIKAIFYKIKKNISYEDALYIDEPSERINNFYKFNELINNTKYIFNFYKTRRLNKFDAFIVGSDQVWNPNYGGLKDLDLLTFTNKKKISFSASFGINEIPDKYKEKAGDAIKRFDFLSVRENAGKNIIKELTGREDVEILLDPTMLLTANEWNKVAKQPKQYNGKKYILNYFLGNLSKERRKEIDKIAIENNCEIINLLEKNDPYYVCGPSEFLWLEKNAFLICTDSFHSSVFAILYNRPFIVFERQNQGKNNMNSRLDTLLSKFELNDRRYNEKCITKENLQYNYERAYQILEDERIKSKRFLEKALFDK